MKKTIKGVTVEVELIEFTQAQYEKYQAELISLTKDAVGGAATNNAIVSAARTAGILTGYTADINAEKPAIVKWLAQRIHEHNTEQLEIPPE